MPMRQKIDPATGERVGPIEWGYWPRALKEGPQELLQSAVNIAKAPDHFDEGQVENDLANLDVAFLLGMLGQRTPELSASEMIRRQRGDPSAASDILASRDAKMYNPPGHHLAHSRRIIRQERHRMPKETSPSTSKDDPSQPDGWSVEKWWAEKTNPYRRRNMTPLQRQRLARLLRFIRRENSQKTP
jgi:hypothetical protein